MPRIRAPRKKPPDPDPMELGDGGTTDRELRAGDAEDAEAVLADVQSGVEGETGSLRAFSVVKMKLNTFVHDGRLKAALRTAVADMNVVVAEAYLFANFHVARLLEEGVDPKDLPSIDRNLYYRCLLAVSSNNCKEGTLDASMRASIQAFDALRPVGSLSEAPPSKAKSAKARAKEAEIAASGKVDVREYGHLLPDASISMATMACNHLWTNLAPRLSRFLGWRHPEVRKALRVKIVDAVAVDPGCKLEVAFRPPPTADAAEASSWSRARGIAERLRALCPLGNRVRSPARAKLTLPLFRHVLGETLAAEANEASGVPGAAKRRRRSRAFALLPNKSGFTASHVQFCKMALLGTLKRLGLEAFKGDGRALADEEVRSVWRRWFGISGVETRRRLFGGRFVTDGCAVAVVMNKPSSALCSREDSFDRGDLRALRPTASFVGVDPGVTDVVTVAREDCSVASYSAARYYEAAHYRTSSRRVEAWNAETERLVEGLGEGRGRTADFGALGLFARGYLAVLRPLLAHRMARGYRSMRFLRFTGKQRAVDAICELVAPRGQLTVVGFGDWAGLGGSPIKRRCAGPLQEVKFRLSQRPEVVVRSVWEHKTSVTCHCCLGRLSNMRAASCVYRDGVPEKKAPSKVHKVLHCKRSEGGPNEGRCGVTWNRDVNASKNILMLLVQDVEGKPRPPAFCPTVSKGKAVKRKRASEGLGPPSKK